ncbi:MAG: ABC transporter substrate-binding protein [Acidimicrobiia bacterium]|nr:ABC transporter substrate-binding protein [Acidimicrobiia bacterium]
MHISKRHGRAIAALALGVVFALLLAACGGSAKKKLAAQQLPTTTSSVPDSSTSSVPVIAGSSTTAPPVPAAPKSVHVPKAITGPPPTAKPGAAPVTVRLGYFPNLTHASAIIGVQTGIFNVALGQNHLQTTLFNAGPDEVTALFAGSLDMAYMGPNPTINAFAQSHGQAIRAISGATSGGASLVVQQNINSAQDLKGKKVASPQLGNTQDVALRYWLKQNGLSTDTQGGGDVSVTPQDNSTTLQTFKSKQIAGAWVPEPYATRLVQEDGGKVLVDERSLWDNGQFVTTNIVVRTAFLNDHPDVVRDVLVGQYKANQFLQQYPSDSQTIVNNFIGQATGKPLAPGVVATAWTHMAFTNDPIARSLAIDAQHAQAVGLLDPSVNLDGIYDLRLINDVLAQFGQPPVAAG